MTIIILSTIFNESNSNNKFSVIPPADEKYISFMFSVWVNFFVDKNGVKKNVYEEDTRFLESFKFMPQSLEKQASFFALRKIYMPRESIQYVKKVSETDSLRRKGVYPCTYMDTLDKIFENYLPKSFGKTHQKVEKLLFPT